MQIAATTWTGFLRHICQLTPTPPIHQGFGWYSPSLSIEVKPPQKEIFLALSALHTLLQFLLGSFVSYWKDNFSHFFTIYSHTELWSSGCLAKVWQPSVHVTWDASWHRLFRTLVVCALSGSSTNPEKKEVGWLYPDSLWTISFPAPPPWKQVHDTLWSPIHHLRNTELYILYY